MVSEGKTVNVEAIEDEEARNIVWGFLRGGGATAVAGYPRFDDDTTVVQPSS